MRTPEYSILDVTLVNFAWFIAAVLIYYTGEYIYVIGAAAFFALVTMRKIVRNAN